MKYFDQRTHRTEALLRPTIRFCQALMLILAASVCSGQTVMTPKVNLIVEGKAYGTFTSIKAVDPPFIEPPPSSPKARIVLKRQVVSNYAADQLVGLWYGLGGPPRTAVLQFVDSGTALNYVLVNAVPLSVMTSLEVDAAGRTVLMESAVIQYDRAARN